MLRKPRMYLADIPCHIVQRAHNRWAILCSPRVAPWLARVLVASLLAATLACSTPQPRPSWWKGRANHANLGYAQADTPGGRRGWTAKFSGFASCAVLWAPPDHDDVNDSRIIVGTGPAVTALVPASGQSFGVGYDLTNTMNTCAAAPPSAARVFDPASLENRIYISTAAAEVYSLPPTLSSPFWKRDLVLGQVGATGPTPWGDFIYVGAGRFLFALKRSDGSTAWRANLDAEVTPLFPPAVTFEVDNAVVITALNGTVLKVDAFDGTIERWRVQIPAAIASGFALGVDFHVYVAGFDGALYALDRSDGHIRWRFAATGPLQAPAVRFHGPENADRIYIADESTLIALGSNGSEKWRVALPARATCAPVVTPSEVVYVGVGFGAAAQLGAVAQDGQRWSVPLPGADIRHLAVGEDGAIYASAGNTLIKVQ